LVNKVTANFLSKKKLSTFRLKLFQTVVFVFVFVDLVFNAPSKFSLALIFQWWLVSFINTLTRSFIHSTALVKIDAQTSVGCCERCCCICSSESNPAQPAYFWTTCTERHWSVKEISQAYYVHLSTR